MEMRRITHVPYQCTTMAWNLRINTHPNDNRRLAATIKRILSQIGPATTPPTATVAGQTWQRSGQIAWLFFNPRWRLWITHTHSQGVKTGRGKEWQAAEKYFPSHRCLPAAGKLGTGKLCHSRNNLIREVLEDAWLKHLPVLGSISRFTNLIPTF